MKQFLGKIFNIREEEWSRILFFFLLYFIIGTGSNIGKVVKESLFITKYVSQIPLMFIVNAIVIVIASIIYSSFADRIKNEKLMISLMSAAVGLILITYFLICQKVKIQGVEIGYFILYSFYSVFMAIIPMHFGIFLLEYLNTLESKRLFPLIFAGARLGGIIAGTGVSIIINAKILTTPNLLLVWVLLLLLAICMTITSHHLFSNFTEKKSAEVKKRKATSWRNICEGWYYTLNSPLLKITALATLCMVMLIPLMDYVRSIIFYSKYQGEQLTFAIAMIDSIASAVAMFIQLFLTTRLIIWLGLGGASLIFPTTTLISFVVLAFMGLGPEAFFAAVFIYANRFQIKPSINNPCYSLFFNAIPQEMRGRSRAFMNGVINPIGMILIGIATLMFKNITRSIAQTQAVTQGTELTEQLINRISQNYALWLIVPAIVISILFVITSWIKRRIYAQELIRLLKQKNFDLYRFANIGYGKIGEADISILTKTLKNPDDEISILAANILVETQKKEAIPYLLEVLPNLGNRAQYEFLKILGSIGSDDDRVIKSCVDNLSNKNSIIRKVAINVLSKIASDEEEISENIIGLLNDIDPWVRANAIILLCTSGDLFEMAKGIQMLNWMLTSEDKTMRAAGVFALGELNNPRFISNLINYAKDTNMTVRHYTIEAIEKLLVKDVENHRAMMVLLGALKESLPEIRIAAIKGLGKIHTDHCVKKLVQSLADNNFDVQKIAQETIYNLGDVAIPFLVAGLEDINFVIKGSSAVLLGRMDLETHHLENLVMSQIEELYNNLSQALTLQNSDIAESAIILKRALLDKNKSIMELILQILTALVKEAVSDIILKSLNSRDSRIRANVIEMLENTNVRNIIRCLEPYLSNIKDEERIKVASEHVKIKIYDDPLLVVKKNLKDTNSWLKAISIYTIGELWSKNMHTDKFEDNVTLGISDKNDEVREASIEALKKHPNPPMSLRKKISEAINDSCIKVSQQAIQYLVKLSPDYAKSIASDREKKVTYNILSTIQKTTFLKSVDYFDSMTIEQLKVLSNICYEIECSKGKILFEQGDIGDALYIIIRGSVSVLQKNEKGDYKELIRLGEQTPFGDMALFGDEVRSASVRSEEQTRFLVIKKNHFIDLLEQYPDLSFSAIKELIGRIKKINKSVKKLQEEITQLEAINAS